MDEQMQQQIVQLVQAAMSGDQQAAQQIQQIMQAAQQGDQEAMQIAQLIQQVAQQLQGQAQQQQVRAARFGSKLNYIRQLNGTCPPGYEMGYFKKGGSLCKKCMPRKAACGGKAKKRVRKAYGGGSDTAWIPAAAMAGPATLTNPIRSIAKYTDPSKIVGSPLGQRTFPKSSAFPTGPAMPSVPTENLPEVVVTPEGVITPEESMTPPHPSRTLPPELRATPKGPILGDGVYRMTPPRLGERRAKVVPLPAPMNIPRPPEGYLQNM